VVVIFGGNVAESLSDAQPLLELTKVLDLAEKDGSGLLEIPRVTNARGLRELGCLPDAGPGLTAVTPGNGTQGIRRALEAGELDALLLFGVDPLRDFPDTKGWEAALSAADFIVSFSMFETATTAKADVVFPIETHAEKDGTVTHPDGRLQRVRPSASRPGDIRAGIQVLAELSSVLGHDTGITSQPSAFAAITATVPFYAGITEADIGGRGVRWQEQPAASAFPPPPTWVGEDEDGKIRVETEDGTLTVGFDPGEAVLGSEVQREIGYFTLGTYRDLWAGPITELNPPLRFLQPQQRVEISLADAERFDLSNDEAVSVGENGTSVAARVSIRERVPDGVCFLSEGVADGNANELLKDDWSGNVYIKKIDS